MSGATAAEEHDGSPSTGRGPGDLTDVLAQLARQMHQQSSSESTLQLVVETALAVVPGAEEASISVVADRKSVQSWAASDELAERVDELQNEVGQGPCLDAVFDHDVVSVPDMASEQRWPLLAQRAAEMGVGSMLSFQLFVDGGDLGAMNLYARTPRAFGEESEQAGVPLAAHTAVAQVQVQEQEQWTAAMHSRELISQALGILMERHKLTSTQAFALLARVSQDHNIKLRVLAEDLVFSGHLQAPASKHRGRA